MNQPDAQRRSLARRQSGLAVGASPFNAVKLDLAVILVLAVVLGLVHGRITDGLGGQLLLLAGFALAAAGWLVWRTRRVLRRESARQRDGQAAAEGADDGA